MSAAEDLRRRKVRRGLSSSAAATVLALAFVVWQACRWSAASHEALWFTLLAPLTLATVTTSVLLGLVALGHPHGGPSPRRFAPWIISLLLLAAAPLPLRWDDGCNDHGGQVPAIALGIVATSKPSDASWLYEDGSTLMACLPE